MIEFTLVYSGELRPNANPLQKHALRQVFHRQLRYLWDHPAKMAPGALSSARPDISRPDFSKPVGHFRFVPVISENGLNVAEVQITLMQTEAAGSIITRTGDIDNRLKSLFDSMKVPTSAELPADVKPNVDEEPFFCVLEDDHLITSVAVDTKRLLEPTVAIAHVQLLVTIRGRHVSEFGIWLSQQLSRQRDE